MKYFPNSCGGIFLVFTLLFSLCGSAFGSSLDRGSMQERYNPTTKDMLRVPGVVGSSEQDALNLLQQSGLSVKIKRITRDLPKYTGQEGLVIKQEPSSGGLAMIGSLVTLTIYKKYVGVEGGYPDSSTGSWGDSEPSSGSWGGSDSAGDSWDGAPAAGSDGSAPSYDGSWPSDSSGGGWSPVVPESGR